MISLADGQPATVPGLQLPDRFSVNRLSLDAPDSPVVVPRHATSLLLTPDRLNELVEHAMTRIEEVSREMGREPDGNVVFQSWMWLRKKNEWTYENDLEWRKAFGDIFNKSNFTTGTNRRYARLLAARVRDDLLSTRPFFAAIARDDQDAELVQQVEQWVQNQIDESNVPETLREALKVAMIHNEAVTKTTYLKVQTPYIGPARGVFIDPRTNMPVLTPAKQLYVFENDDVIPDLAVEGLLRLRKDPSFAFQDGQYPTDNFPLLPQRLTHYDNCHVEVLDSADFLCPLKERSTDLADINVHIYEADADSLRGLYGETDTGSSYFAKRMTLTGARQPRAKMGEDDQGESALLNRILVGECYLRFPPVKGQPDSELLTVLDLNTRAPIFYDYLGNHMSRRPFNVIPGVERVPLRWYGVGVFSKMEHSQLYIDAQFNRINEKDSMGSSVTFRDRNAVAEWKAGAPVKFGSRDVLNAEAGYDPKNRPPIWRVNLQSDAELNTELMGLMQQQSDLEFGVIGSRDASASDLNQSKTATGVMSVERDANVICKDTEIDITFAIEGILDRAVEMVIENMDPSEFMFDEKTRALATLNRDEIRSLRRRAKLLLTKARSAEMLATNEKAEAIWMRYMQLDPMRQYVGRPLYLRQLKGLEIDDADKLLPEKTLQDVQAWQKQQEEAAKNQQQEQKPVSTSISTKYTELARSEQIQLLAREGLQAAPPEEIAAMEAKDQQEKAADAALKAKTAPVPKSKAA